MFSKFPKVEWRQVKSFVFLNFKQFSEKTSMIVLAKCYLIVAITHSVTRGPAQLRSTPLKSQSSPGNSSGLDKKKRDAKAHIVYEKNIAY